MAIVIDGSNAAGTVNLGTNGTISNLAVGGLPDGTVDRDTLATVAKGSVLQIQNTTIPNTNITTSSNSWSEFTSCNVAITPKAANSKIFIQVHGGSHYLPAVTTFGYVTIYRDSTNIGDADYGLEAIYSSGTNYVLVGHSLSAIDEPNTTSEVTYKIYGKTASGTYQFQYADRPHITLTAMEIAQ